MSWNPTLDPSCPTHNGLRPGCARCGHTGYRGRVGVFQLLTMSERLEQLAAEKAPREEIERAAAEEGMRTMWEDGVGKVAAGVTSVEELARQPDCWMTIATETVGIGAAHRELAESVEPVHRERDR